MSFKLFASSFLAACGLVCAAGVEDIQQGLVPDAFKQEQGLFSPGNGAAAYRPALGIGGSDWQLGATLYAGGGALQSESMADTVSPRGFLGAYLTGRKDSAEFALNLLFDNFDNKNLKRYKDLQFTGHIGFRHDWIQLRAGRDAEHFGPGVYNNLTFNRAAYAYDNVSVNFDVGPLKVYSFYGGLQVAPWKGTASIASASPRNDNGEGPRNDTAETVFKDRDVYGHRYEVNTKNFTFGISEATVLYDNNQPWLFVPTVPLFMEKGNYSEDTNNGVLSFDAEYRFLGLGRVYTEFLLDDMESPIRLIANDNVESKWGWMAGIQLDKDLDLFGKGLLVGTVAEYARVEPFVYTHFYSNTAQHAHAGRPLGNPNGPNSQAIDWSVYAQFDKRFKVVLHNKWLWKGTDYGSQLNDQTSNALHTKKSFLTGAKMQYSLAPYFTYTVDHVSYQLGFRFFNEQEAYGNVIVWW